ncbi:MAG: cytochrome c oxidase accessory protein CcoG [bacterium]
MPHDNINKFRDELATVTSTGKRKWVYPKKPSGKYYTARTIVSIFLLIMLFITPFIKLNGHPFILLNILERNFILFGIPFGPHDFHLFGLAMITLIVFIFLFTAVYGRLFCGWFCPQTVFLEMVFRKIEYWIEGDANKQKSLDNQKWNKKKLLKKTTKHVIFYFIAFVISNIFLAYIIGIDQLTKIITDSPSEHTTGLTIMVIFSFLFYLVFSRFREQACTMVCPYGRLQGVLLDQNSIVIAYDYIRGEERGKIVRNSPRNNGDCIDCKLCVDVCPTGIDIRNGTQLECVNCTACIDACDTVMEKVKFPKGLIRYASKNEITSGKRNIFTPRAIGYTVLLVLLISILSSLLINRTDVELSILRTAGLLYQEQPDNKISNLYDMKIINKTFNSFSTRLELKGINGEIKVIGSNLKIKPQEIIEAKFFVILDKKDLTKLNTQIKIAVVSNNKVIDIINTSFLGKIENKELNN